MKRLALLIVLCLFGLLSLPIASAYDTSVDGLHRLADLMPDDLQMFIAAEISPEVFTKVDTFAEVIGESMPLTYPPDIRSQWRNFSLGQALTDSLLDFYFPMYDLYPVMGQYMGIGGSYNGDFLDTDNAEIWIVMDILDQQQMHEVLLDVSQIRTGRLVSTGDIITYEIEDIGTLSITQTHLLMSTVASDMFDIQPLSKNSDFIASLNTLEEDHYDGIMYLSKAFMQLVFEETDSAGFDVDMTFGDLQEFVMGFKLLDHTAMIDMSWQSATPSISPPLNPTVLENLPASTDFMVATADFSNLYHSMIDFIRSTAELDGEEDPTPFIELALNYGKLDFEEHFLSWTTGTYVVFMGADFAALVDQLDASEPMSDLDDVMFGIAFEATDPDQVDEFIDIMGDVLGNFASAADELTIKPLTINGRPALNILLNLPADLSNGATVNQFVLVPTDTFLYVGTANGYEEIESGKVLGASADLTIALDHALTTPNTILYMNSELSVLLSTLVVMAADEPFYEMLRELQGSRFDRDEQPTVATYYETFDWLQTVVSNATSTVRTHEDGTVLMRITLSLK